MKEWILSSSVLIIFILLVRGIFRKRLELRIRYALWLIVAVRLLIPVSFAESRFSVLNLVEKETNHTFSEGYDMGRENSVSVVTGTQNILDGYGILMNDVYFSTDDSVLDRTEYANENETVMAGDAEGPREMYKEEGVYGEQRNVYEQSIVENNILYVLWLTGSVLFGILLLIVNVNYARKVSCSAKKVYEREEGMLPVYYSPIVKTPCMFGLRHPAIYLTSQALENGEILPYILAHENTHYRHRDNWWAVVRTICICIHWYNPLVWLAVYLSRQDCELACDEETLQRLGEEERIAYGRTLLAFSIQGGGFLEGMKLATTMSGGKRQLKERLQMIVRHPKRYVSALLIVFLLMVLVAAVTFTGKNEANELTQVSDDKEEEPVEKSGQNEQKMNSAKEAGRDVQEENQNWEEQADTLQPYLFGYSGYTGYLDECIMWTEYERFVRQDYDEDGLDDRVWRENIKDWRGSSYRIEFGNGDVISVERIGDGIPIVETGDLTGDGKKEIMFRLSYGYSTDPAGAGAIALFQKGENGYERMKLPGGIVDEKESGYVDYEPTLTFKVRAVGTLDAHLTSKNFYETDEAGNFGQSMLDVVVPLEQDVWNATMMDSYTEKEGELTGTVYSAEFAEGIQPCLRLYVGMLGKYSEDEVILTLAYKNGSLKAENMQYLKHGTRNVYLENVYVGDAVGGQYLMQIGSITDVKTNLYEITYMHFAKVGESYGIQTIDLNEATTKVWGKPTQVTSYSADANIFFEDLNFDGYVDFGIQGWTANRNVPYYLWLWNPVLERFEYSCWLPNVWVDKERRLLISESADGGGEYSASYFAFDENNSPYLVRYEAENLSPEALYPKVDLYYVEADYSQRAYLYTDAEDSTMADEWAYWAKEALLELYKWSGTKLEKAYFTVTANGGVYLAESETDLKAERTYFYRYFQGAAVYSGVIESMGITYAEEVSYSPIVQRNVPEAVDAMNDIELLGWYFEHSGFGEREKIESVEESFPGNFIITTQTGQYYELTFNEISRRVDSVYGPYPEYPRH